MNLLLKHWEALALGNQPGSTPGCGMESIPPTWLFCGKENEEVVVG